MTSNPDLSDLRRQIDAIDDQIHELLMQRTEIVKNVRVAKKGQKVKIRPAREAEIIYRLFGQHKGPFPKRELFRIWRELITATLRFEGKFSVAVFMDDEGCGYWDIARDQYGSFTPMQAENSARRIVELVHAQDATVGILPLPERTEDDPWWRRLVTDAEDTPRVIARLPFAGPGNARTQNKEALVICPVPQEPTGRDRTYLAFEVTEGVPQSRFTKAMEGAGLNPVFTADWHDPSRPMVWLMLAEVEGFVDTSDPRLTSLNDALDGVINRTVGLGGYALPVTEKELDA